MYVHRIVGAAEFPFKLCQCTVFCQDPSPSLLMSNVIAKSSLFKLMAELNLSAALSFPPIGVTSSLTLERSFQQKIVISVEQPVAKLMVEQHVALELRCI